MKNLALDMRYAVRMLLKNPGFTAVAVLTLGLGIGANTAIFSLASAIYLQALPLEEPHRLVHVYQRLSGRPDSVAWPMSYADYLYYREHSTVFDDLAAHYSGAPMHLVVGGELGSLQGAVVTGNYFLTLRMLPRVGRFFRADEDQVAGHAPVAVISSGLWQRRFGSDPQITGKVIDLNGTAFTVVGVAPASLETFTASEVWIPSAMFRAGYRYCDALERGCAVVTLIGRLRPGRNVEDAQTELAVLARQLEATHPDTNAGRGVLVSAARGVDPNKQKESARTVLLLLAIVAVVLLIACANLAGLLLAQGITRRKEIAVRLALGASRVRLIRQLLTENLLLSLAGGTLGLFVAVWVKDALLAYFAVDYAGRRSALRLELDLVVLGVTLAISLLTAIVFGLIPALRATRPELVPALRGDGFIGERRPRLRDVLVVAQVALSVVLLVGAGLLIRSLQHVYHGPGFDPSPVVVLRLRPILAGYAVERAHEFQLAVHRKLEELPGVLSATPARFLPVGFEGNRVAAWLPGQAPARGEDAFRVPYNHVGSRYLETLGVPLREGRDFDARDRQDSPLVVIVNETLARRFWPEGNALGQSLVVNGSACQVVGIAKDAQYRSIGQEPLPFAYLNYWQAKDERFFESRTHVRVAGDARAMLPIIRKEIAKVDPNMPISEDYPLTERVAYQFRLLRAATSLLFSFAVLGLFLSLLGLYGVLSFAVSQRTREIAIRMALGAARGSVTGLVVRHGFGVAAAGVGAGSVMALAAAHVLRSLLYGVSNTDPWAFVAAASLLCGVVVTACWIPARRATRVDPMIALRYE